MLRFDYTAPTAALLNPSVPTSSAKHGGIGDKANRYKLVTSVCKRMGAAEPYFELHYTLPVTTARATTATATASRTRRSPTWAAPRTAAPARGTATRPAFTRRTWAASSSAPRSPSSSAPMHQRIAFDLRGWVTYTSEGRYNNELSDLMGKLLYSSDYTQIGG